MKTFQKLKKWLASFTTALLLVATLTPSYTIAATTTDTVTVDTKVTNDQRPELTGTMSSLTDLVSVTVNGVTYGAINNGDGTWTLADDVIPESFKLSEGIYDVIVSTYSGATDTTVDELTIDLTGPELIEVTPIPEYTNLQYPTYKFSSNEPGEVTYNGLCGKGDITKAVQGINTVKFGPYSLSDEGAYDNCQIVVTDIAGNSTTLDITPFTIDMTAPTVMTYAEFVSRSQNSQRAVVVSEPRINDNGVYIEEDSEDVSVVTKWQAITPTNEGSVRSYTVTYIVTDAAGNVASSTPFAVELTTDEFDAAAGDLPLTLIEDGDNEVTHERGPLYTDLGAKISNWNSPLVHVWTYGNLDILKTGVYELEYRASAILSNPAVLLVQDPPAFSAVREVTVVDTIGPDAVSNLKAFGGNGYVQLTWVNPVNDDLAGLNIYRSTEAGVKGTVIAAALSPETVSFDDYTVVNGETYYYTVTAFDSAANNGKDSLQVGAMPQSPKVAATTSYYDYQVVDEPEAREVKSDETEDKTEVEDQNQVPVIGVIILILLILLGLYLLYLQSPGWFSWLFFWKKKASKSNKKK